MAINQVLSVILWTFCIGPIVSLFTSLSLDLSSCRYPKASFTPRLQLLNHPPDATKSQHSSSYYANKRNFVKDSASFTSIGFISHSTIFNSHGHSTNWHPSISSSKRLQRPSCLQHPSALNLIRLLLSSLELLLHNVNLVLGRLCLVGSRTNTNVQLNPHHALFMQLLVELTNEIHHLVPGSSDSGSSGMERGAEVQLSCHFGDHGNLVQNRSRACANRNKADISKTVDRNSHSSWSVEFDFAQGSVKDS